jgi:hypothetical protein
MNIEDLKDFAAWLLPWAPLVSIVIATCSVGFAIWALIVARKNAATAREALRLASTQEERRLARLDVTVEEATLNRRSETGGQVFEVTILAVNPTDRDGSIIRAELVTTYSTSGQPVVARFSADVKTIEEAKQQSYLAIPSAIKANGALRGSLTFTLSDSQLPGNLEAIQLEIYDSRSLVITSSLWGLF